jgi:DtxR family Mn-dependent transcriptional regulator
VTAPDRHPAADYLEAIYELAEESIPTIRARVADWMGVSRASVSEAVDRLIDDGLVKERGRELTFTARGRAMAETLVRRHRLVEHFLIRILGLPWHRAHEEAERWERVISDEVEQRMTEVLDDPPTCPHGNLIPGSANSVDQSDLVSLTEVERGRTVILRRLTEDLELELDVMRFFEDSGLMPGSEIEVLGVGPDGSMSLAVRGRPVALGAHLADNVWVEGSDGGRS